MATSNMKEIEENLNQILIHIAQKENIDNFEIKSNTNSNFGDGFVGQFYQGFILNKDTGETVSVAIKQPSAVPLMDYNMMFKNEDSFYRIAYPVLDDLQKESGVSKSFDNVPKYFSGDVEPKKEYIAMEDLKPLGYVMFDKTRYLDKEHLEMIFKTYAKFHALSYVLRKKDLEQFQNITKEIIDISKLLAHIAEKPMVAAVSAAVNSLDPEKDKIVYDEIKDFGEHSPSIFLNASTYNGKHRCLIHGDCWSNNMLFKYSDSGKLLDMKLLDFQLCKDNSLVHDLSYFFYSGASKQEFDRLDDYLEIYFQSFSEFAKELGANSDHILPFEDLKKEWKDNAIFGVIMGIYIWQLKLIPKVDIVSSMTQGDDDGVKDEPKPSLEEQMQQWALLLGAVHSTDLFRERTTAILRHAFEYGVINRNKIIKKKE